MTLTYLQIFSDMRAYFDRFSIEERGQLFTAMMDYAFEGIEPAFEKETMDIIWTVLKSHIDRCEREIENGRKGGRPKKQQQNSTFKANEKNSKTPLFNSKTPVFNSETPVSNLKTPVLESKTPVSNQETPLFNSETGVCHNKTRQDNTIHDNTTRARARESSTAITGIDGTDVSANMERISQAEQLIKRYGLGDNDRVLEAVIEDVENHGLDAVEAALNTASMSSKNGLSVNYYRAILNGTGKKQQESHSYTQDAMSGKFYYDGCEVIL